MVGRGYVWLKCQENWNFTENWTLKLVKVTFVYGKAKQALHSSNIIYQYKEDQQNLLLTM